MAVDDTGAAGAIPVPFDFTHSRQELPTGDFAEEAGSPPNTGVSSPPKRTAVGQTLGPQTDGRTSVPGTGGPFPAMPPKGRS